MEGTDGVDLFSDSDIDSLANPGGEGDKSSRSSLLTVELGVLLSPFSGGWFLDSGVGPFD